MRCWPPSSAPAVGFVFWPQARGSSIRTGRAPSPRQLPPFVTRSACSWISRRTYVEWAWQACWRSARCSCTETKPRPTYARSSRRASSRRSPLTDAFDRGRDRRAAADVTVLLDAHDPIRRGGTGRTIDWTRRGGRRAPAPRRCCPAASPRERREAIARVQPVHGRCVVRRRVGARRQGSGQAARVLRCACANAWNAETMWTIEDTADQFGHRDPDSRGYYGAYGGRFVPETLVAPVEELEARVLRGARGRDASATSSAELLRDYVGRPTPLYEARAARRSARRRAHLPQARGSRAHRRAQDQQRARPGAARAADGEAARHRRDRRGAARRRDGDRLRAARPRVRRLHGRRRHGAPVAERLPDAAARRDGAARRRRQPHAEGRDQRGDARLGHERRATAITCSARCSARTRIR